MQLWRNDFLVKVTLFFFATMLFFSPAYAGQGLTLVPAPEFVVGQDSLPVIYVGQEQASEIFRNIQREGYVVKETTLAQLDEVISNSDKDKQENSEKTQADSQDDCDKKPVKKETSEQADKQAVDVSKNEVAPTSAKESTAGSPENQKSESDKPVKNKLANKECGAEKILENIEQAQAEKEDADQGREHFPEPEPDPELPVEYYPEPDVHGYVAVHADAGYNSGGDNRELAKAFIVLAGVVVVAAFIVYAGKYIADIAGGKDVKLWRELTFTSTFLDAGAGRSAQLSGAKLALGLVSDELIQLALVGEIGGADLDLVLNENTNPVILDFSANYWMLGATARLHLSDKLRNASYLFLDFMGGTTSRSSTGIISAARLGANFGLNDYVRLGASIGAQYIGLNENQGFANDGDNYWMTYGVEIGMRF